MIETLDDVLVEGLRDIYNAEKQLTRALPKMVKGAKNPELKSAFQTHLAETETHVARLDDVFTLLEKSARGKKCAAMEGLVEEGGEALGAKMPDDCRDATIIEAAQKVEHYEIAAYGTLRTFAEALGRDDIAGLLEETLEEEKAADQKLTEVCQKILEEIDPASSSGTASLSGASRSNEQILEEEEEEESVSSGRAH